MREHITLYLNLAAKLNTDSAMERHLSNLVVDFPPLTSAILDELVQEAEREILARPRLGWAIMAVTDAAAARQPEHLLQAKAAWFLAWAANEWVQPKRVAAAVDRAQALFTTLDKPGWVAACQWQRNTLPWTRPDSTQARIELEAALEVLPIDPETRSFVPHCRLALAYLLLMVGLFDEALTLIDESEAYFKEHQDILNQARCWFVKAACLRRKNHFGQAMAYAQQALECFEELRAAGDIARTKCQIGYLYWSQDANYAAAEQTWHEALTLFIEMDIPIWQAQVKNGLVQIFNETGRFAQIGSYQKEARAIYEEQNLAWLLADVLLDSVAFESSQGNYDLALEFVQKAQHLYASLGSKLLLAVATSSQGVALWQARRYQQALASLEEALRRLQSLNVPGRMARCEINLANVWLDLGQSERAHAYLERALEHSKEAHQADLFGYITICRAKVLLQQRKINETILLLEEGLVMTEQTGNQREGAVFRLWLGEALCHVNRLGEAVNQLHQAEDLFEQLDVPFELAACQLAWGRYYERMGDVAAAQAAWQKAIDISQGIVPDIAWMAHAGLAALAEQQGQFDHALEEYSTALDQLVRVRGELTQPALSSSFFSQPETIVAQAVHLAVSLEKHEQAIRFIETNKALALAHQLNFDRRTGANLPQIYEQRLTDLIAEIHWLEGKLRVQFGQRSPLFSLEARQLHKQLKVKSQEYDDVMNEVERMVNAGQVRALPTHHFDQAQFQQLSTAALGSKWLALDYYLTETHVHGVAITPTRCESWQTRISPSAGLALDMVKKPRADHAGFSEGDYKWLADLLLPAWVCDLLHPEVTLLIAPHGDLHRLPWPALWLETINGPLINACVPVIVPSLNSLIVLWQRIQPQPSHLDKGLLVAVAEFGDRHIPLPAVQEEAMAVIQQMNGRVVDYCNAAATWANLQQLANTRGLQAYSWLHIASHAFYDGITGRLSGLALHDRDIWVDELKQISPLPPLVILSVCSGNRGRIYHGDEQIGLTTTCLVAGAQTVISSLWPILDKTTPQLFLDFYQQVAGGTGFAQALALAQRAAIRRGVHVNQWSSFCCIGQP